MANIRYVAQGLDKDKNFFDETTRIILNTNYKTIWILSAYAKEEAVINICNVAKQSKAAINAIIGVRNGTTSQQALAAFLNAGARTYQFDVARNDSIFHMKTTVAYGDISSEIIVGSANMTTGGLSSNIEGGVVLTLDRKLPEDETFLQSLLKLIESLCTDYTKNVKQLSISDLEDLLKNGIIEDENISYQAYNKSGSKPESGETVSIVSSFPLQKKGLPFHRSRRKIIKAILKEIDSKVTVLSGSYEEVWQLSELKASHVNAGLKRTTKKRGNLSLVQGAYSNIDQRIYFRQEVFKNMKWMAKDGRDYTVAPFNIIISGINYGQYDLKISHDPRTDTPSYKQGNYMTSIHWGPAKAIIENEELIGRALTLYRSNDGEHFIIKID